MSAKKLVIKISPRSGEWVAYCPPYRSACSPYRIVRLGHRGAGVYDMGRHDVVRKLLGEHPEIADFAVQEAGPFSEARA